MLYIRADGNGVVGLGHIMRCLSIADGLKRLGQETTFLVADQHAVKLIHDRGYETMVLESDYQDMGQEIKTLLHKIEEYKISFLLIDSYFVSYEYFQKLSPYVRLAYIDDIGTEAYPIDVMINYNIYGPRLPYKELYQKNIHRVQCLLGSSYAPLRKDFIQHSYQVKKQAKKVLVTTGGADTYNVCVQYLEKMTAQDHQTTYHVISGPFHTFCSQLKQMAEGNRNIVVHENVTEMAQLMGECDIAVSAAGSTLYELCAIGVPTIYFYFVKNQELPAKYFELDTQMINAGNYVEQPTEVLDRLVNHTKQLLTSYEKRVDISQSMRQVTDGNGAERIAQCLKAYLS